MKQWVADYVKGCSTCQQNKTMTHPRKTPLYRITTEPEALPFQQVCMDLITGLPLFKAMTPSSPLSTMGAPGAPYSCHVSPLSLGWGSPNCILTTSIDGSGSPRSSSQTETPVLRHTSEGH